MTADRIPYLTGGAIAYWVDERHAPPSAQYIERDGHWWLCVSHWGPVHDTGILAVDVQNQA